MLLLDEPTLGEVLAVVADLAAAGQTMMIVTHEIAFARRVAHGALVLVGGRIVEAGTPEAILDRLRTPETRAFLGLAGG